MSTYLFLLLGTDSKYLRTGNERVLVMNNKMKLCTATTAYTEVLFSNISNKLNYS